MFDQGLGFWPEALKMLPGFYLKIWIGIFSPRLKINTSTTRKHNTKELKRYLKAF
jgi:hypothetical protein